MRRIPHKYSRHSPYKACGSGRSTASTRNNLQLQQQTFASKASMSAGIGMVSMGADEDPKAMMEHAEKGSIKETEDLVPVPSRIDFNHNTSAMFVPSNCILEIYLTCQ